MKPINRTLCAAALLWGVAVTGAAHAAEGERAPRLLVDNIQSWKYVDEHTLLLEMPGRKIYEAKLNGDCRGLNFVDAFAIRTITGWLSGQENARIYYRQAGGMRNMMCYVTGLKALPEARSLEAAEKLVIGVADREGEPSSGEDAR
jgi:hypothetical protein